MRKLTILLLLFFVILISCSKTEVSPDMDNPQIEMVFPKDNPSLRIIQPLCVKAIVSDDTGISLLYWDIIETSTGKIKVHKEFPSSGNKIIVVEEKLILPSDLSGGYSFKLSAGDRAGNVSKFTLPFSVNN